MAIVLGDNEYGKAETRLLHVARGSARHEIRDLNVSTSLRGDFTDAHVAGNQARVLPTDTQKNTVFAFAREHGVGEIEDFAATLARHFVTANAPVREARVEIDEYPWARIPVGGAGHEHSFVRSGEETRHTAVTATEKETLVVAGVTGLSVLKSTGSQFRGFATDPYTTLEETDDRVLATSLTTRWSYRGVDVDWSAVYADVRRVILEIFADTHSRALQHTLYAMGEAVLTAHPEVAEIRFTAPNIHCLGYDLSPFGLDNPGEIFHVDDRPYGLIKATVTRDDSAG